LLVLLVVCFVCIFISFTLFSWLPCDDEYTVVYYKTSGMLSPPPRHNAAECSHLRTCPSLDYILLPRQTVWVVMLANRHTDRHTHKKTLLKN